ncbi:Lrp/AsnC family transcriptional regulator [Halosimplex salinum]|uniref:Lrp/AsnC family transcriptional regulator n=1 Tax=Halosimplex salinum TaxID=1710538 RepID=UPI000F47B820|nr:Lrp/AsnC family transcriptional regulator [Halosimplex salinum]
MVDIDDTDRQLIDALLADGRASSNELAAEAGIATATATKRVQALEADGVVDGYRPDVDYDAFGYDVTAVFHLDVVGDGLDTVVADLRDTGHMVAVYEVTGGDDVVAVGKFTDTESLNAEIKTLLVHDDVESVSTSIVLETVCEDDPLPVSGAD